MPSPKKDSAIADVVNQGLQRLRPDEGGGGGGRGAPYCGRAGESCWNRPSLGYANARRETELRPTLDLYAGLKVELELRRIPATAFGQSMLSDMHFLETMLLLFNLARSTPEEAFPKWRSVISMSCNLNFGKLTTRSTASSLHSPLAYNMAAATVRRSRQHAYAPPSNIFSSATRPQRSTGPVSAPPLASAAIPSTLSTPSRSATTMLAAVFKSSRLRLPTSTLATTAPSSRTQLSSMRLRNP